MVLPVHQVIVSIFRCCSRKMETEIELSVKGYLLSGEHNEVVTPLAWQFR